MAVKIEEKGVFEFKSECRKGEYHWGKVRECISCVNSQ